MNEAKTDSERLRMRLAANRAGLDLDLGAWIAEAAAVAPGERILELGAGTGEHSVRLAERGGWLDAVEVSAASASTLRERLGAQGQIYEDDMDQWADPGHRPECRGYNLMFSAYALYYSRDVTALLSGLTARLNPGARWLIVGPAPGNNREWYDLLARAEFAVLPTILDVSETFIPNRVLPWMARHYDQVEVEVRKNRIPFRSESALLNYWRANLYFDAENETVPAEIRRTFAEADTLFVTKRILMLSARSER